MIKKIIIGLILMASSLFGADVTNTETNKYVFTKSVTATGDGFIGNGAGLTNLPVFTNLCVMSITNNFYFAANAWTKAPYYRMIYDNYGGSNANSGITLSRLGNWRLTYNERINTINLNQKPFVALYIIQNVAGAVFTTNQITSNGVKGLGGNDEENQVSLSCIFNVTNTNCRIESWVQSTSTAESSLLNGNPANGATIYNHQMSAQYIGP